MSLNSKCRNISHYSTNMSNKDVEYCQQLKMMNTVGPGILATIPVGYRNFKKLNNEYNNHTEVDIKNPPHLLSFFKQNNIRIDDDDDVKDKVWDRFTDSAEQTWIDVRDFVAKAGKWGGEEVLSLLASILTGDGLKFLFEFELSKQLILAISKSIVTRSLYSLSGEMITEQLMAKLFEKGFSTACITAGKFITVLASEAAIEKGAFYAAGVAAEATFGVILGPIFAALLIIQLIGMIIDMWDPCKLSEPLDKTSFVEMTDLYNTIFRDNYISSVASVRDSYGNSIGTDNWPLEYYAEDGILPMYQSFEPSDEVKAQFVGDTWDDIKAELIMQYLQSMSFNAIGLPISFGADQNPANMLMEPFDPNNIISVRLYQISNKNKVVSNWISKWWPLLLCVIIVVFIILIRIINE